MGSILLLVGGGLTILRDLIILLARGPGSNLLLVLADLAFGVLSLYLGLHLRRLMPWARSGAIALSALSLLLGLLLVARHTSTIVGMILPVAVIVLMYRPDTRAAFPRAASPVEILRKPQRPRP